MELSNAVSISFASNHIEAILNGNKTVTLRIGLEQVPSPGQPLALCGENDEPFAAATTSQFWTLSVQEAAARDWTGHRNYSGPTELCEELGSYYPECELTPTTTLQAIAWREPIQV